MEPTANEPRGTRGGRKSRPAVRGPRSGRTRRTRSGRLKIGDEWMAIQIIALSQTNPQKAVAELVENSLDAGATRVTITRARRRGRVLLRISDDGRGVPLNAEGVPSPRPRRNRGKRSSWSVSVVWVVAEMFSMPL